MSGTVTPHGPVCVDWDGDGIPDDWEIAHGLNPGVNDAALDRDGDGASNLLEYARGTDPLNPDTDGDGIAEIGAIAQPDDEVLACRESPVRDAQVRVS